MRKTIWEIVNTDIHYIIFHSMDFVEELKWRGMLHDIMPGTEEQLAKAGYRLAKVLNDIFDRQ